jgi:hypothetical protein
MTSEAMISCSNIWGWKTRPYLVIINVKVSRDKPKSLSYPSGSKFGILGPRALALLTSLTLEEATEAVLLGELGIWIHQTCNLRELVRGALESSLERLIVAPFPGI